MTIQEGKTVVLNLYLMSVTPQLSGCEAFYEFSALRYSQGKVELHTCTGPIEDVKTHLKRLAQNGATFYSWGKLWVCSDCADIQVTAAMYNAKKVFATFSEFGFQELPELPMEGYCSNEFDEMLRLAYDNYEEKLISNLLYRNGA